MIAKIAIFFFISILPFTIHGQKKYPKIPRIPSKVIRYKKSKYSLETRLKFHPFDSTAHVRIMSFNGRKGANEYDEDQYGLPVIGDSVIQNLIDSSVILSPTQIATLTDIMYNECSRYNINQSTKMGCDDPRNAIVFYDCKNKMFEYIDICFGCHQIKYSNKRIEEINDCDYFFEKMQLFMSKLGLKTTRQEFENKQWKQYSDL
jgi:hypothetical protein